MQMYWVQFKENEAGDIYKMGCGVTARNVEEVIMLLQESSIRIKSPADIASITKISYGDIEENHILPNIGNVAMRGIWYPRGA